VRLMVGAELEAPRPVTGRAVGRVGLPLRPDERSNISNADIAAIPGVIHAQLLVEPGEVMGGIRSCNSAVAWLLIEADDVDRCEALLYAAVYRTHELHDRGLA